MRITEGANRSIFPIDTESVGLIQLYTDFQFADFRRLLVLEEERLTACFSNRRLRKNRQDLRIVEIFKTLMCPAHPKDKKKKC